MNAMTMKANISRTALVIAAALAVGSAPALAGGALVGMDVQHDPSPADSADKGRAVIVTIKGPADGCGANSIIKVDYGIQLFGSDTTLHGKSFPIVHKFVYPDGGFNAKVTASPGAYAEACTGTVANTNTVYISPKNPRFIKIEASQARATDGSANKKSMGVTVTGVGDCPNAVLNVNNTDGAGTAFPNPIPIVASFRPENGNTLNLSSLANVEPGTYKITAYAQACGAAATTITVTNPVVRAVPTTMTPVATPIRK